MFLRVLVTLFFLHTFVNAGYDGDDIDTDAIIPDQCAPCMTFAPLCVYDQCPNYPSAECKVTPCTCHTYFQLPNGRILSDDECNGPVITLPPPPPPPVEKCPGPYGLVACPLIMPMHQCGTYGSPSCPPGNYCCRDGCNTNVCRKRCEVCQSIVPLCQYDTCRNYPEAVCIPNKCGCGVTFRYKGKTYTPEQCNEPMEDPKCPATYGRISADGASSLTQRCGRPCDHSNDCSGDQICCKMGACGLICVPGSRPIPRAETCPGPLLLRPCTTHMQHRCGGHLPQCPIGEFCCNDGCVNVCRRKERPAPTCTDGVSKRPCITLRANECSYTRPCRPGYACCNDGCINVCRPQKPREDQECQSLPSTYDQLHPSTRCQKKCALGCKSDEICCSRPKCGLVCIPKCRFAPCPGPPCDHSSCNVRGAKCVEDFCNGCFARWYLNGKKLTSDQCSQTVCPDGRPERRCLVNPCDNSKCPSRQAECTPNYCKGCIAEWFDRNGNLLTEKQCEEPLCERFCDVEASCSGYVCDGHEDDFTCVPDTCSNCSPLFYDGKGRRIKCRKQTCPDGRRPHRCDGRTCKESSCRGVPGATCIPNKCDACKAEWFDRNGNLLTDLECSRTFCKRMCPDDVCDGYLCRGHEDDFQCVVDSCACKPMFFDATGSSITCEKVCPDGTPPVMCIANPCDVTKCPRFPHAKCVANFCGGCHADFYVNDKLVNCNYDVCPHNIHDPRCPSKNVGCQLSYRKCRHNKVCCAKGCDQVCSTPLPPQPYCPRDSPKVKCRHPCETQDGKMKKCPGYPTAVCRANFCGKCEAEWFVGTKQVQCRKDKPGNCPIPPKGIVTPCVVKCFGDDSCSGTQKCCSYGCMVTCMEPDTY